MSFEPLPSLPAVDPFSAADVAAILRAHGWLPDPASAEAGYSGEISTWMDRAAALLGPQATEGTGDAATARARLEDLLGLVFQYDAGALLRTPEAHEVLLRRGARKVVRELAHLILGGPDVDSDRFKEIVNVLKEKTELGGRGVLLPVRLVLAGRTGEGELDRVILLLDGAAQLPLAVPVKGTRQRMLEFCAALD